MTARCSLVALVLSALALPAAAQPAGPIDADLLPLIPQRAFFFLEHRGHAAVHETFLASNLGQMYADPAIHDFVHDTRVKVGQMIMESMFELASEEEVAEYQQTLHELLKPFWYQPAAMFAVADEQFERPPGVGFICLPGDYAAEARAALEKLVATGVPEAGEPGERQAVTYETGSVAWTGVAKHWDEWELSDDPEERAEQLREGSVFLVHWRGDNLLCVALSLDAADAMGEILSGQPNGRRLEGDLQATLAATQMQDWAFRWYVDAAMLWEVARREAEELPAALDIVGLTDIRGVGGTEGYVENVWARRTYLYSPGKPPRFLAAEGSYEPALAMMPPSAAVALAGQFDHQAILDTFTQAMATAMDEEDAAATLAPWRTLVAATDGRMAVFVTDLQTMAMMGGPEDLPVGIALGIADAAQAKQALEEFTRLAVETGMDEPAASTYRRTEILAFDPAPRVALLEDRVIVAMGDTAMKAAIDAALDNVGGFEADSAAARYAQLAGEGQALFVLDLAALAQLGWPFLMQAAEEDSYFELPLASLPSTDKMVRLLGPEIAVLRRQEDGLLLESRGKIPFSTKLVGSPFGSLGMMLYRIRVQVEVQREFVIQEAVEGQEVAPPPNDEDF